MGTVLKIAQDVADDLSLAGQSVATLFGFHEEGDTTARRLRRAIERTCKFLASAHDWQQIKRDYEFLTLPSRLQTRAIPHDFLRMVPNTMFDKTRRIPLQMADSAQDFSFITNYPVPQYAPAWEIRGNDIWFADEYHSGSTIAYKYISSAVCEEPAKPMTVSYTTNGMTLEPMKRYVVRSGHAVKIPALTVDQVIELVPEGGTWVHLGCSFETLDGGPISNTCPVGYSDWLTIVRYAATYEFKPQFGAWAEYSIPTSNGMTLEAGRRYMVGQGHQVYLPVLGQYEQIEILSSTSTWLGHNSKYSTRDGLEISPPQTDVNLCTITSDMTGERGYILTDGPSQSEIYGRAKQKTSFTLDTDVPFWDDELVTLGSIWLMNYRDGNQYNEDFRSFERMMYDRLKGSQGYGVIQMGGKEPLVRVRRPGMVAVDNTRWNEVP